MSMPTQDDLIGLGWGLNGESAAFLAPSSSYVEQTLGWGYNGEVYNAPAFVPPPVIPIINGRPSAVFMM